MSDGLNTFGDDEELISLESDPAPQPAPIPPFTPQPAPVSTPQPVPAPQPAPVPQPVPAPQPVPMPPPAIKPEEDEPISLVDETGGSAAGPAIKRVSGAAARGLHHMEKFKRPLNITGQGATRCRVFSSKIAEGPLLHMETVINEWLDQEEVEVKHVGHVIGTMEGKRAEPNVVVLVWY